MTTTMIHPFEKAGLGIAPFRFVGMSEKRGPIMMPDGSQVGYQGQPMGTCDFCGMGIAYCCEIQSADGKRFIVGCDCVARVDEELEPKVRTAKRNFLAQTERKAREDAERAKNGGKTDNEIWEENQAIKREEIQRQKDIEAVADAHRVFGMKHIGTIGQKIEVLVKIVACIKLGVNDYGAACWLLKMVDNDRNAFTWFTTSMTGDEGEIWTMRATVKDHNDYKGEKQTVVTRCKFGTIE